MAEKILEVASSNQFKADYTRYGIYILYRRVLSDYRDGLKPVQRRILWAMYKNTKAIGTKVKSAAIVGDVMKFYHPHGDCLRGDTVIYKADGSTITIEEVYKNGITELEILTVNLNTGRIYPAYANNFRIGQYTTAEYHITFSNDFEVVCTNNHPFLSSELKWIKAEDLEIGTKLFSAEVYTRINGDTEFTISNSITVKNINVVNVDSEPMYDFTVDLYENMIIPIGEVKSGITTTFISVHNSAIYGTMIPMANWFESKVPLIDPEGNFGTFQGDPFASSRYTECCLSKFSIDNVLGDIMDIQESVDWSPTYNGATIEPDYLPVKLPLLLVNGSFGIGLGIRAEIPTHNLAEVIDATLYLMDHPDGDITLVPDHCMSCEIINTDFSKICKAGFGHYRIRGKVAIEDYRGKKALVIYSVPNLTTLNSITDKIEELIKKKKIIQIDNCFDESNLNTMRFVILLKPGSDPNYVREVIYKNTALEQTLRIDFETLNGLNPLRMSYKSYLLSFIDLRRMTKFRVYSNKLQVIQTKIHERDAYIRVLESGEIDNIIAMIKKQKVVDDDYLIEYLIKKLKITDLQAKYIISADLKKLSYGYLSKYKQEAAEFEIIKNELLAKIMSDKAIEDDIRAELLEIKAKYGKPRCCTIIDSADVNDIPKGEMIISITDKNFIRKTTAGAPSNIKGDNIKTMIKIDNTDSIIIFDEMGKVFKLPVHKIPITDKNGPGTDVRFLIKTLTANINTIIPESIIKTLSEKGCHNNKHYLVTLTNAGLIKRMDLDDFTTVPPSGILYVKVDKGDSVKDIIIAHSNFDIIVYAHRKAVMMHVNDIPYLKRNTKGSKAMSGVDNVDGMCIIHNNCTDIVVITESGRANRISLIHGMPNNGRGKSGSNLIKLASGDKIVGVVSGNENDLIHIKCTDTDSVISVANLQIGSSISAGEKILTTRGNKIIHCYIERAM